MPLWRCPHCATPQPEAARCWVCQRSTTCCATCRHYRRGVASGLGYCGLDRGRAALHGAELRSCWTAPPATALAEATDEEPRPAPARARLGDERVPRTFVPVEELEARRAAAEGTPPEAALTGSPRRAAAPAAGPAEPRRWSLWGDDAPA